MADLSDSINDNDPKRLWMAWGDAVDQFRISYEQLTACSSQISVGQEYIGQCSVSQLRTTITGMQVELENLLLDKLLLDLTEENQFDSRRLKQHTLKLNQCTNQAQLVLLLTSMSST